MLPWASPLEGLLSRCSDQREVHRSGRRSAVSVRRGSTGVVPFCRGSLGRRCLRGPKPALLANQRGLRVRVSLTGPPSWLATCPAGCPAGVRCRRPDRYLLPRECRPEGRRQAPHPVACLHRVCLVILSRFSDAAVRALGLFRRDLFRPRTVRVSRRQHPRALLPSHRCHASPASAASCLGRGPSLAGPSLRPAEARVLVAEPRGSTVATCPGAPVTFSFVPEGTSGEVAACWPEPARGGAPRQPSLPKRGRLRSPSCRAQCAFQPALAFRSLVSRGIPGWVTRTRSRDDVPPSGAAVRSPEGEGANS
jgi:hypothetical protein